MRKFYIFLFYLFFPLIIFENNESDCCLEVKTSEVLVIGILDPPFYSGTFPTYYIIITYNGNDFEMFFQICTQKEDADLLQNKVRTLDIKIGEKYNFNYVQRNIYGVVHGYFTIVNINVNYLSNCQKIMYM